MSPPGHHRCGGVAGAPVRELRRAVRPGLDAERSSFVDGFTGASSAPGVDAVRGFVEITAVNELDVVTPSPSIAARTGAELKGLMRRAERHLCKAGRSRWRSQAPPRRPPADRT